jgi:hypothetical protein
MSASSKKIRRTVGVAVAVTALAGAGSAFALQALPPGAQVNNDPAAGINPGVSVSGDDPTNADVVGGALTAGKVAVPWAVFRQQETNGAPPPADQIFSRSFAGGAWTTRGSGTVGGRSSATPQFSGSLNFDQGQDGEAPAIDFAGAGRTVPWATWYEETAGFGHENIFASRFDNTGDANQGKWIFGGQGRGTGGVGSVPVPSLNIHTNQNAENPSVAGGSAVDATKPGPWVTWQETSPANGKNQIYVVRPEGPGKENCDGVTPLGEKVGEHIPAVGGFCWQQTGVPRVGAGPDPSLNVDPTRDGVEPDIAFTGAQDAVPWVVWYEEHPTGIGGLHNNEMVFAAKGIPDAEAGHGGFHWVAVGSQLSATLDTTGTNKFGACAESATNEAQCSLNKNANENAEDPRVAAGTMNPAKATVPWVAWDEEVSGVNQIFVSRLVGAGAEAHFELANGGAPISTGSGASTRPDITFSGNTPYVSWREEVGGTSEGFYGHFVNAANPTFVPDESGIPLTPTTQADVREPISSSCTANPFNGDGAACQGGAVGTPFFLFTSGSPLRSLFADAYSPDTPITGGPSGVSSSAATVSGAVNPEGAAVIDSFQYGTTTAYGKVAGGQSTGVSNGSVPFAAALTGLPAGTTIHYRAVAVSDFGTFVGADQVLTTAPNPPGPGAGALIGHAKASSVKVSGSSVSVRLSCTGPAGAICRLTLKLTVTETFKGHKLIAISAKAKKQRKTHKVVQVGTASVTLKAGQSKTVKISLNGAGKALLASHHGLKATLRITQAKAGGGSTTVFTLTVKFKPAKPKHKHHSH